MNLAFTSQPPTGTANYYLTPRLTAKLTSDRRGGTVGGIYAATAILLDCTGSQVEGVLGGNFNATGECNRIGTEVTFKWDWLSISTEGLYQLQVTVVEFAPDRSMCIQRASATTNVIDVNALRR